MKGDAGAAGARGEVGAMGPQGLKGDIGPAGAVGPQGPAGTAGAVGAAGPQGPQGERGLAGEVGSHGPSGPSGATGALGPQGPQGPQGPAGTAFAGWLTFIAADVSLPHGVVVERYTNCGLGKVVLHAGYQFSNNGAHVITSRTDGTQAGWYWKFYNGIGAPITVHLYMTCVTHSRFCRCFAALVLALTLSPRAPGPECGD